jgi:ribosomal-protein-alanine N-acetyltransferase
MKIERMTEKDLPEVLAIERSSFPIPFSENLFRMELKLKLAQIYVAREEERIVGYIDYWNVGHEIHLITIAVAAAHRRRKTATSLVEQMMKEAKETKVEAVALDVRPSNQAAVSLYRQFGFTEVGVRKNYYQDNNEDALVMIWKPI